MALSTLNKLLAKNYLRRGDGVASLPEARRTERLFSQGRSRARRAGECKMELMGVEYDPRDDTCIKACVRLIALQAAQEDLLSSGCVYNVFCVVFESKGGRSELW